ncbi:cytochrome c1 [Litoribrevibacter euphylliae]|uniref:Cytochrome c1 n=1 Tax=Litoribrevibacter euphylliae TaxID=1834034 RepID=A0ABV7HI48_9GAMM
MKKLISVFLLSIVAPLTAVAAGSGYPLDDMNANVSNKASLQRGAQTFMNYCMGCHAMQYSRYERVADDLHIPHELMVENLIFDDSKIGQLMHNSMTVDSAKRWFGAAPPDLTLVARVRGEDWLYTYLRTFYEDPTRPLGVNNEVFPNVGMPHVLMELQGLQKKGCAQVPVDIDVLTGQDITEERCDVLYLAEEGTQSPAEYEETVYDLVNFLVYTAEPMQEERVRIGIIVMLFLVVLFICAYLLNREYWKDIH